MEIDTIKENLLVSDWDDPIEKQYRARIKSPQTAIRAMCVVCMGGQPQAVAGCSKCNCPLFPFRMGKNPFHKKSKAQEQSHD